MIVLEKICQENTEIECNENNYDENFEDFTSSWNLL